MAFTYTKAQLKNVLVDKKIYDGTDDDGDFYYILEADDKFDHDVVVYFILDPKKGGITCQSFAKHFEIKDANMAKMIMTCNEWNKQYIYPRAFVNTDSKIVTLDYLFYAIGSVEDAELGEMLHGYVSQSWRFFVECNGKND
jgi:hypothetical protein